MYTKTLVAGLAGLSLLLVPALSGAAAPNGGTWKGDDVSFIVNGRQGKVVGFRPTYRVEWKCGNGDRRGRSSAA